MWPRGQVKRALTGAAVFAAVAAAAAWALIADNKAAWAVMAGVAAALAGSLAPTVLDTLRGRAAATTERDRRVRDLTVIDLPESVAWLLHPSKEVIDFFGRGWDLRTLRRWCDDPDGAAVRLVTAPGGYGKTRLARHFAARLDGWTTWEVANCDEAAAEIDSGGAPSRLLAVVDYAETREPAGLARLLCAAVKAGDGRRVRVLLLARAAGLWWEDLSASYPEQAAVLDGLTVPRNVLALEARADEREPAAIVADAAAQFATRLGRPVPGRTDGGHPLDTPVLRLHAEALLAVLGGPDGDDRYDVLKEVNAHEARYWRHQARRAGLIPLARPGRAAAARRRLVGLAALLGADTEEETAGLVRRVPDLAGADPDEAAAYAGWLRGLYPADAAGRLATLQPDLLAETLAVDTLGDCTAEQRAAVLTGLRPAQAAHALTVLSRAHAHRPGVPTLLDAALGADVPTMAAAAIGVARQFPGLLAPRLAALLADADLDIAALRHLARLTPHPSRELNGVALALTTRIVADDRLTDPVERAMWLGDHAVRLTDAGRRAEALAASAEGVDLLRSLVDVASGTYLEAHAGHLAVALLNYGNHLDEEGRQTEALAVDAEAIELLRVMAVNLTPALAAVLSNYALRLGAAGRRGEALAAGAEAVALWRHLAAADRDAHLSGLATALGNQASHLGRAGRWAEGVAASAEAVALCREAAAGNPDAYLPNLAATLGEHAMRLSDLGRSPEALAASAEAVELRRGLVAQNRDAFLRDLALSLANHANRLTQAGRPGDALAASAEAVDLRRSLAAGNRDAHLLPLAVAVNNHAAKLAQADRLDEALDASAEAVGLWRELVGADRHAHETGLAGAMTNHAAQLAQAGHSDEAINTATRAVLMWRGAAAVDRDAHLPDLATALWTVGWVRVTTGAPPEAGVAPTAEAVAIFAELADRHPDAFTEHLRAAENTLAELRDARGRHGP